MVMSDLVERLRGRANQARDTHPVDAEIDDRAADEIERLTRQMQQAVDDARLAQVEIERLRTALEAIANYPHPDFPVGDLEGELDRAERIYMQMQNIARFGLSDE